MRRTLAIVARLLGQFRRDRRTMALLFGVPLVVLTLFGYLVQGERDVPRVGIVNEDAGPLGHLLVRTIGQPRSFRAEPMALARARDALRSGEIAAYVRLPADFTRRITTERIVAPEIVVDLAPPGFERQLRDGFQLAFLDGARAMVTRALGRDDILPRFEPTISRLGGRASSDPMEEFGAGFVGLVVFFLVFVVTIVSFQRERTQGTLERMLASPVRRGEIAAGYMIAFALLGLLQGAEILCLVVYVLKLFHPAHVGFVFLVEALLAIAAVNLAVFLSTFARTEFQAVQFIPLVVLPQILLSGIILPIATEPVALQYVSKALPLTYAVSALRDITVPGPTVNWPSILFDAAVVAGYCLLFAAAAATTLKRRIA